VPFVLFEREGVCGGRLINGSEPGAPPPTLPEGGWVRMNASVVGLFADDGRPFLAALQRDRLHLVFYRHLLLANGGQPTLLAFPNNDLPGVFAARAVSRLIRRHGVVPGERIAVVGDPAEARELAELVTKAGSTAVAVGMEPVRAHGVRAVQAITASVAGKTEKFDCDAIALCTPPSPAFELARAAGARVAWDPRAKLFVVDADVTGQCAPNTWAAGELRGPMSAAAAAEQGLVAAEAIVRERAGSSR
jgi:sarcosine oxidase subunit alpha